MSFTVANSVEADNIQEIGISGGKITLINDTSEKLSVHTGSGSVSLNPRGGRTSFSCNTGKKVKVNGNVVFTINDSHRGETIKLSTYLD